MTPVFINKLFVNQSQPDRIQYVMGDGNDERRLWVTQEKDPALFAFLKPHVPAKYRQWLKDS
jgi:hypothetical protein